MLKNIYYLAKEKLRHFLLLLYIQSASETATLLDFTNFADLTDYKDV